MFHVVSVGCHSVLNHKISVCCFIRDDVNNTFIMVERTQRIKGMGNRKVSSGVTKLLWKKAEKIYQHFKPGVNNSTQLALRQC